MKTIKTVLIIITVIFTFTLQSCNSDYDPLSGTMWCSNYDGHFYEAKFFRKVVSFTVDNVNEVEYYYYFSDSEIHIRPKTNGKLNYEIKLKLNGPDKIDMIYTSSKLPSELYLTLKQF